MKTIMTLITTLLLAVTTLSAQDYDFEPVKDINPSGQGSPRNFTEYNGKLYFTADDELWVTDGTPEGTQKIAPEVALMKIH